MLKSSHSVIATPMAWLGVAIMLLLAAVTAAAEDGSRLWLRTEASTTAQVITANKKGATLDLAVKELREQWKGAPVQLRLVKSKGASSEGFSITGSSAAKITITAAGEQGLLYGTYHLLRLQATNAVPPTLSVAEQPKYRLRLLNHWDNLDRTVERGYAGLSLWRWDELPDKASPRYEQYARANASIGINGAVLNNVNANPKILTGEYLQKVKTLADIFRPYNLRVYLAVNFSSPAAIGGLPTSDPLDPQVQRWWSDKAKEIYALIPDFGGFLVKANSEGLPGPQDFGRTHLDGANMLADVLAPHNGVVMWRAFVYNPNDTDRAKQAYQEFMPFDGKFKPNVIVQVKNGPVDFQPREPFSPLFGAMQKTPVMPELQITQEYLGFSNHLAYLATLFEECLQSDTYALGAGSTVAKATDGTLFGHKLSAIAGVANIGEDANWCGHHFAQASWYAFGRMAWNHELSAESIAREWLLQTFTGREEFVAPTLNLMLRSREAVVDYMMPLGLHHLFAWAHHYGPEPWCAVPNARPDWLPSYYHKADSAGIGFNRSASGSNAAAQYFPPLREKFNDAQQCDERLLLWFHHLAWSHKLKSGRTLWDELCYRYQHGVDEVRDFQKVWDKMQPYVDAERFAHVQARLRVQLRDAVWWKDACLLYFQTFSRLPIPYELERPTHNLHELQKVKITEKEAVENTYCIK